MGEGVRSVWLAMGGRGTGCFLCLLSLPLAFRLCSELSPSLSPFLLTLLISTHFPLPPHLFSVFCNISCTVSHCPWRLVGRERGRTHHPVKVTCVAVTQTGNGDSNVSHTVLVGGQGWLHKCQGGSQNPELGAVQRRRRGVGQGVGGGWRVGNNSGCIRFLGCSNRLSQMGWL